MKTKKKKTSQTWTSGTNGERTTAVHAASYFYFVLFPNLRIIHAFPVPRCYAYRGAIPEISRRWHVACTHANILAITFIRYQKSSSTQSFTISSFHNVYV